MLWPEHARVLAAACLQEDFDPKLLPARAENAGVFLESELVEGLEGELTEEMIARISEYCSRVRGMHLPREHMRIYPLIDTPTGGCRVDLLARKGQTLMAACLKPESRLLEILWEVVDGTDIWTLEVTDEHLDCSVSHVGMLREELQAQREAALRSCPPPPPEPSSDDYELAAHLKNLTHVKMWLETKPSEGDVWRAIWLERQGRKRRYLLDKLRARAKYLRNGREFSEIYA